MKRLFRPEQAAAPRVSTATPIPVPAPFPPREAAPDAQPTPDAVQAVGERVQEHLAEIAKLFRPGVKLTILVRAPFLPDGDLVVTDDNLVLAEKALARRRKADRVAHLRAQRVARERVRSNHGDGRMVGSAAIAAEHLASLGPPERISPHCEKRSLTGQTFGALKVLGYIRPGRASLGEGPSPWWRCVCSRCGAEQAQQGHLLRNRPPYCRACGAGS